MSFCLFLCFFTLDHYQSKTIVITKEFKSKKWQINNALNKIELIEKQVRRTITEDAIATQIIFPSNKEDSILLFDFIDDEYEVSTYNFDVKKPEKISIYKDTQYYDIVKTEISASFNTDAQIKLFMFLDEMSAKMPGYTHIKTLYFADNIGKITGYFVIKVYTLKLKI